MSDTNELSRWRRQRHSTEIKLEQDERNTMVFTQEGRNQYDIATRDLKPGEDPEEYRCKETFKGDFIPEKVLAKIGVFFSVTEIELEHIDKEFAEMIRNCGVKDGTGKIHFAADGEIRGVGKGAIMLKLPGWIDGPMAFAGWTRGSGPELLCYCEEWEYHWEDWYLPNAQPKPYKSLEELAEEQNLKAIRTPKPNPFK